MVDKNLPMENVDRKLRYLFLDFNSFFASVEQQERPELRGKPIAVAPVDTDSTVAVAASYEAKKYGVRTGTKIFDAKRMCPEIQIVSGNFRNYKAYHEALRVVAEDVLPVNRVHSIDEMSFRLLGDEREPAEALEIARTMKKAFADRVGECMTCSIGIAPNLFLSKTATEMEKPDGLVMVQSHELPHKLHKLRLTDFCGINRRMEIRLNAKGIFTVEQMCRASKEELRNAFGSIMGEKWWYLLQGFETIHEESLVPKTLGHSHVLPPELRTDDGAREVLLRLIQKATARLRSESLWSSAMIVYVSGRRRSWWVRDHLPPTQDTITINDHFLRGWQTRDFVEPVKVGITFYDLKVAEQVTPSLFDPNYNRALLNRAVDKVNQKFGKNKIYLAGMEHAKDTGDEKIAFNKVDLFREGKNDNNWEDTFHRLLGFYPGEEKLPYFEGKDKSGRMGHWNETLETQAKQRMEPRPFPTYFG